MKRRIAVAALVIIAVIPVTVLGIAAWHRLQTRDSMAAASRLTGTRLPQFAICSVSDATCAPVESSVAGHPAVLVFTRPGCPFCDVQIGLLREIAPPDVRLIPVVVAARDAAREVAGQYRPLTSFWDGQDAFRATFRGTAVPFTIVVDRDGVVRHASIGQQSHAVLNAALKTVAPGVDALPDTNR
jgi:thiol-disulfide isomerase/thioredoxin